MKRFVALLAALPLCAHAWDLRPNDIRAEVEHISHVTQHFGAVGTNYGYNDIAVVFRWRLTSRLSFEIAEGMSIDPVIRTADGERMYGALFGPREVFHARIDYTLWGR